jgi:polysaccharide biosynthesis transport protein
MSNQFFNEPRHNGAHGSLGRERVASSRRQPGALTVESVYAKEVFAILRRRIWIVLGAPAIALVFAVFMLHRQEPMYRASALVLIKDSRRAVAGGIEDATNERPMGRFSDALLSQIELLRGRDVLGDVVDREGLRLVSLSPEFSASQLANLNVSPGTPDDTVRVVFRDHEYEVRTSAGKATAQYGAPVTVGGLGMSMLSAPPSQTVLFAMTARETAIDRLAAGIQARPRSQTDAVEISFTAPDPVRAQRVANALVLTFQESSIRAAQQRSQLRRIFLEAQLHATDSVLADAQLALSRFRTREVVYSSREKLTAQQQGLMSLQMRRAELEADHQMYRSLLPGLASPSPTDRNAALRTLVSSPEIASNAVVSSLYGLLVQYQAERDALTTGPMASTDYNPDVARLSGLVASTESNLIDAVRSHVAALQARVDALDGLRALVAAEIQELPQREAEEVRLVQNADTYRRMADQLREDLQKARIAEAVEAGKVEIIHLAPLPAGPVGAGQRKRFAIALALGLFGGVAGAFVVEVMNSSIRRREEIEEMLQIPQLAVIPRLPTNTGIANRIAHSFRGMNRRRLPSDSDEERPGAVEDLGTHGTVAYRMLCTNLMFSRERKTLRSILVTSAGAGEGKTTTASNLAITFARSGLRVLLVDYDLESPRLHSVFGLPREPGVTEMVLAGVASGKLGFPTQVNGLDLLPAGKRPPDPAGLLTSSNAQSALGALAKQYDLLVIDTPPLLQAAETMVLAAQADVVLLVLRAGQTQRAVAQHALQQLEMVGANFVGAVLNDPDQKAETYGGYYSNRYA